MKKTRLALIGLGLRGEGWVHHFVERTDMDLCWICDVDPEKIEKRAAYLAEHDIHPKTTTDFNDILSDPTVEAVMISASWEAHIPLAIACLEAGKPTGLEVGGTYSVNDCFRLIETQERTGTFFMFMENCCYGRREMMALDMVNHGIFGEVVHCSGGYCHDLRDEIARGRELKHYRLRNYLNRNCDNYPTHQLLPIMKLLGINDGNRLTSIISVASCAKGLAAYSEATGIGKEDIAGRQVAQGDVVTSIIKCAHGETITLTLETTLPRYYSRKFEVHGTKGMYVEDGNALYFDNDPEMKKHEWNGAPLYNNADTLAETYDHPLWKKTLAEGLTGGHGGMDGLVMSAFLESIRNGWESPIDVYDGATCMAISALSEASIQTGGTVAIPDFTGGKWLIRTHGEDTPYTLRRK